MVSFGNTKEIYYAFAKEENVPLVKIRIAAEEMYRLYKEVK